MMRYNKLEHRFVQYIPDELEPSVLYVSMEYATAAHSCCCGCGLQVITPFTPTDWKLTFDGETVSLWPSIGNWNFPCRSHYIIRNSRILGAEPWEEKEIQGNRRTDKRREKKHFEEKGKCEERAVETPLTPGAENLGLWDRLKKKVRKKRK
jgi:hypothetical protein